ncbi:PIN domain-containing protein [Neisseria sp.]|uniref:PIN domain-containing protein n=1 Tax=Neisseria sp. TaxID=192066 RepID=UPI0035A1334C
MKHILIDFENVRPEPAQLAGLDDDCHIWLFLGKLQQKTLSLELCEALCRFGKNVHFVRVAKTGKNALDFYLAYYLGRITEQDKNALVFILSRDGGYDVLVEHLEDNSLCGGVVRSGALTVPSEVLQIGAERVVQNTGPSENPVLISGDKNEIPLYKSPSFLHACTRKALEFLRKPQPFMPKVRTNLELRLAHHALKEDLQGLTDSERRCAAALIVDKLLAKGFLEINLSDGFLIYRLDTENMLECVIRHLEKSKPKKVEAAKKVLKVKADSLFLDTENDDLDKIIEYCAKQKRLRVNGDTVEYPPFAPMPKPVQTAVEQTERKKPADVPAVGKEVEMEIVNKAKKFFAKSTKNKPGSKKALANSFKAALKLDDKQIEKLIGVLAAQKMFTVQDTGKIVYK